MAKTRLSLAKDDDDFQSPKSVAGKKRKTPLNAGSTSSKKVKTKSIAPSLRAPVEQEIEPAVPNPKYRATLVSVVRFFKKYNFNERHVECVQRTAFAEFIPPFMRREIPTQEVRKSVQEIYKILVTYDKNKRRFIIGGKELQLSPIECQLIFGVKSGATGMNITFKKSSHKPRDGIVARHFQSVKRLQVKHLNATLDQLMKKNQEHDIEDVTRIVLLFLMVNFFFTTGGDVVPWSWIKYVEDLDNTINYNWAQEITSYFLNSMQTHDPESVTGCSLLILYWLAERSSLVLPKSVNAFPRFRKWNISSILDMVQGSTLESIDRDKVRLNSLEPLPHECQRLFLVDEVNDANTELAMDNDIDDDDIENSDNAVLAKLVDTIIASSSTFLAEKRVEDAERVATPEHVSRDPPCEDDYIDQCGDEMAKYNEVTTKRNEREAGLKKYVCTLEADNENLIKSKAVLEQQVQDHLKKIASLESVNAKLQATKKLVETKHVGLNEMILAKETKLSKLEIENHRLNEELAKLQSANTAMRIELETSKQSERTLKEELQKLNVNIVVANERKITGIEAPSFSLNMTQHLTQPNVSSPGKATQEIMEMHAQNVELKTFNDELRATIASLKGNNTVVETFPNDKNINNEVPVYYETIPSCNDDDDFEDTMEPKVMKKNKKYKQFLPFRLLPSDDRLKVSNIADRFPLNYVLWDGVNSNMNESINLDDIFKLLERKSVTGNIMDSCAYLLMKQQDEGHFASGVDPTRMGKSLIFPSLLLGVIRKNMKPTQMVQHFMKGKDVTNFRYLLFPLNSGEGPMSRIPHWTLLVYDRINCSWEHFNSSLPRRLDGKEDPFLVDAKEMKSFMQIANGKMKFGIKSNAKLVSVLTSPQQKPDSVDCGMFVLYIARQFCRQQPLDIKDAQNGICALRSDFVHQFLNDEHTVKLD